MPLSRRPDSIGMMSDAVEDMSYDRLRTLCILVSKATRLLALEAGHLLLLVQFVDAVVDVVHGGHATLAEGHAPLGLGHGSAAALLQRQSPEKWRRRLSS